MLTRYFKGFSLFGCLIILLILGGCGSDSGSGYLNIAVCDPANGSFTLSITNPYLLYAVGSQWIYEGDEDGTELRLQITVLDETEIVAGVVTRVVEEREWEDDELIEVSRNFFVQHASGTVCYFGEDVDIYEDGEIVSSEGAWRAGENGNLPGIMMPANPRVGMRYMQEVAPGIAEDEALIVEIGESFTVPAGVFNNTLVTEETNPLDADTDEKRYAFGVGLIVDAEAELIAFDLAAL
jgi:hypothetical protein